MNLADQSAVAIPPGTRPVRLFLCGDVMTGRGVDQLMRHPCDPRIYEGFLHSATDYVRLAERANGPVPRHVDPSYIWGAAFDEWDRMRPDARIVNLETAITHSEDYVAKGINYRMSPENADCLAAARIDCCVLANNHMLDWGRAGLMDTLAALERLNIKTAGAGHDLRGAAMPAALDLDGGKRILVFAFGSETSGIPGDWAARPGAPGVQLVTGLSEEGALTAAKRIASFKRPDDLVVVSIHWGSNWGYEVPDEQRRFARALIDNVDVAVVHGHSSHHAKGIEVYQGRLILYGCGDFLNDYEGIQGYENYRGDLALMYFADFVPATSKLAGLKIVPLQIKNLRLVRPSQRDVAWISKTLDRESSPFGPRAAIDPDGRIAMVWS